MPKPVKKRAPRGWGTGKGKKGGYKTAKDKKRVRKESKQERAKYRRGGFKR